VIKGNKNRGKDNIKKLRCGNGCKSSYLMRCDARGSVEVYESFGGSTAFMFTVGTLKISTITHSVASHNAIVFKFKEYKRDDVEKK
jgi:hypothetical protein